MMKFVKILVSLSAYSILFLSVIYTVSARWSVSAEYPHDTVYLWKILEDSFLFSGHVHVIYSLHVTLL